LIKWEKNKLNNKILKLQGTKEKAEYKEQEVDEYKGNPFIEALPPVFSNKEIVDKFYFIPKFEEADKNREQNIRFHLLQRIKTYKQVLPIHLKLEHRISTMIRRGYLARNPRHSDFFKKLELMNDIKENKDVSIDIINNKMKYMQSTADCLTIIGISGVGKTTAIERLLLMYPQVIYHTNYNNQHFTITQIVWLKIETPDDGSLATLCRNFFMSIDGILNTRYFQKYGYTNRSPSLMMLDMAYVANLCGIGVLVIDEIQQLLNTKNNMNEIFNFFVSLSNTLGIPTILIGTPMAKHLFKKNLRQARRSSSNGYIEWDKMNIQSDEWNQFVKTLWKMQCLREYVELTDVFNEEFYEQTQGIISVAINLFILAQEKALIKNQEKITVNLLKETSKNDLKILQPMLSAIKIGTEQAIADYDDISINYEVLHDNNLRDIDLLKTIIELTEERKANLEEFTKERLDLLFVELKALNIFRLLTDNVLKSIIEKEIKTNPVKIPYDDLKTICIKKALNKNEQIQDKENSTKTINKTTNGSVLDLYNRALNDRIHPYEVCQKYDYIKNPRDELVFR
jgi:GTPase SAR1 family protein